MSPQIVAREMSSNKLLLALGLAVLLLASVPAHGAEEKKEGEEGESKETGGPEDPFCEFEDCYAHLGIKDTATKREIKRAYRKLSLEWHPDKAKGKTGAKEKFMQIGMAYEVLSNPERKKGYDYFREHPHERTWGKGVAWVLPAETDVRMVLLACIVAASILQYAIQNTRYEQAVKAWKSMPKNRQHARGVAMERLKEEEKKKPSKGKKGAAKVSEATVNTILDEMATELEVEGGYCKPKIHELVCFSVLKLPYTLLMLVLFYATFKHKDPAYMTRKALGYTELAWSQLPEEEQEDLVAKELWKTENMEQYKADGLEDMKKNNYEKYKKMIRMQKRAKLNSVPANYNDD